MFAYKQQETLQRLTSTKGERSSSSNHQHHQHCNHYHHHHQQQQHYHLKVAKCQIFTQRKLWNQHLPHHWRFSVFQWIYPTLSKQVQVHHLYIWSWGSWGFWGSQGSWGSWDSRGSRCPRSEGFGSPRTTNCIKNHNPHGDIWWLSWSYPRPWNLFLLLRFIIVINWLLKSLPI